MDGLNTVVNRGDDRVVHGLDAMVNRGDDRVVNRGDGVG